MPFSEMRNGKTFHRCGKCGVEFQYGQGTYNGYGDGQVILCKGCGKSPFEVQVDQEAAERMATIMRRISGCR